LKRRVVRTASTNPALDLFYIYVARKNQISNLQLKGRTVQELHAEDSRIDNNQIMIGAALPHLRDLALNVWESFRSLQALKIPYISLVLQFDTVMDHNAVTQEESETLVRVDDLWFPTDTVIVIRAENKIFRVSGGILAARSSVFRDMSSFPQPKGGDTEQMDGIPIVRLHDSADDVEVFLRAIYDSRYVIRVFAIRSRIRITAPTATSCLPPLPMLSRPFWGFFDYPTSTTSSISIVVRWITLLSLAGIGRVMTNPSDIILLTAVHPLPPSLSPSFSQLSKSGLNGSCLGHIMPSPRGPAMIFSHFCKAKPALMQ
jgi:hypothetical protein